MIRFPRNFSFITVFATALSSARGWRKSTHLVPVLASLVIAAGAVALVSYLLWPTWSTDSSGDPAQLPVSVGGTLFNIPIAAIRMKIQRHSGPQERIDLYFAFPSLEPPTAAKHLTADMIEETVPPIDRIFLSITAHHASLAPDIRVRTIYPRYLGEAAMSLQNGLTMRAFRDGTPYGARTCFPPVHQASMRAARATRPRPACA